MSDIATLFVKKAVMNAPGDEWKRVYQGGHHCVYCDGETHLTFSGGGFADAPLTFPATTVNYPFNVCDCAEYDAAPTNKTHVPSDTPFLRVISQNRPGGDLSE